MISSEILETFTTLDDYDIVSAMKAWAHQEDFVLSELSRMLLNRDLLKIKLKKKPIPKEKKEAKLSEVMEKYNLTLEEATYFVFEGLIENQAYDMKKDTINLITKTGKVIDVAKASDQLNIEALSKKVVKYYLCYPKAH